MYPMFICSLAFYNYPKWMLHFILNGKTSKLQDMLGSEPLLLHFFFCGHNYKSPLPFPLSPFAQLSCGRGGRHFFCLIYYPYPSYYLSYCFVCIFVSYCVVASIPTCQCTKFNEMTFRNTIVALNVNAVSLT